MTVIPTPWQVGVKAWSIVPGQYDRQGNPLEVWADPVPLAVHAIGPRLQEEPDGGGGRRWVVVEGLDVFAPAGTTVGEHDRVVWQGDEYDVDGDLADWTKGPWFNPAAGVVIHLTQTKG